MNGTRIIWKEELVTGNDIIDIQHKELINRISKVLNTSDMPNSVQVADTINFLFDYVFDHFALEEKLMIQTGYENFDEHLKEHSYYINYVNKLKRQKIITRELISEMQSELQSWFLEHIINEDRKMAEHLRKYCVEHVHL